ncbi:MAG: hypothetical protein WBX81_03575 [Nitrososphaeraceae archaeon]
MTKTYAPSSTNNLAVASAIPLVAPVMTATLFSNFFDMDRDKYIMIENKAIDDRVQRPLAYNYTSNGRVNAIEALEGLTDGKQIRQ